MKPMPQVHPNVKINTADYQRVVISWDETVGISQRQAVLVKYGALPLNESVNMEWKKMVVWLPNQWDAEDLASEPTIFSAETLNAS